MNEPVKIGDAELWLADCMDVLPTLEKLDSCITDPPYGISFMNKKWDYAIPEKEVWQAVIEILKPGAHALIACGTRTQHRMAVNIEDGGFEIRDLIAWVYGSGFPKSLNIGKAIDRQAGVERKVIGENPKLISKRQKNKFNQFTAVISSQKGMNTKAFNENRGLITAPATPEARQWDGWGTGLKPAMELWTLCRKPLSEKTVVENILKHGSGGINIDECRIVGLKRSPKFKQPLNKGIWSRAEQQLNWDNNQGRFPANFIHDGSDEVLAEFNKAGNRTSGGGRKGEVGKRVYQDNAKSNSLSGARSGGTVDGKTYEDESRGEFSLTKVYEDFGSAARFFYTAKASKSERDHGVTGKGSIPKRYGKMSGTPEHTPNKQFTHRNDHPTVKPIKLMEYLITLITPPNGIVLDPYMGSGSTGIACARLGRKFIGIEIDERYFRIACERIQREYDQGKLFQ
ncbi:MAG: site-specific DNA-methyltransferase [Candidatus Marinimicrobia bacterium]|nr:site-specific DNA-methyltransferase [Candidatus Neomarinimicrobiota bacterium]